ncbi:MAG: class I SAM-dependent rRNA methyltransferase [Treponema sp.]|jgi:23S rRNA (cytosine1962-C5)-methyltransferase|nr:class I SAM-dependent rRNA methyltransferase [Treponema sp.]
MKRIILKAGEEKRILAGHPWVFGNEVDRILEGRVPHNPAGAPKGKSGPAERSAPLEPGELADVESSRREYLGRAFANPHSKILARIYSPSKEGVDRGFFKRRLREALARRIAWPAARDLYTEPARLVFAEADFLPGLIIDRFTGWPLEALDGASPERPLNRESLVRTLGPPLSWLVTQFLSYGMDSRREEILAALEEVLGEDAFLFDGKRPLGLPAGIVDRSPPKIRELEGLPPAAGLIRGSVPSGGILIFENGYPFLVNLEEGQKTGYFLDQRDNRRLAARYAALAPRADGLSGGAVAGSADPSAPSAGTPFRILDLFAYTGGFAIHALRGLGASPGEALCVDASGEALRGLKANAALNGLEGRITTLEADAFEYLRAAERRREAWDLIVLDPPAFAKTRSALADALRGYREINLRAIKILKPGGVLFTCSCSQALDEGRFMRMVAEAAADAERRLIRLDFRYQAADHPVLVGYDESLYLKCGVYRAVP